MNNDEAMAVLVAKRNAINAAINGLNRYRQETDNWEAAVKTSQMAEVKQFASDAGADLSIWDGTDAP
jgi:hypothetical protein|tara:strand:+ start:387 stop:587 length:201 start_codon:yes stop_codon:yes gene_type:complete